MKTRYWIAVVAVLVVVVGGAVAGAAVLGVGPFGAAPSASPGTGTGSASGASGSGGGGTGGSTGTATSSPPPSAGPFQFVVTNVTKCGTTCRDVGVALTNTQNRTAKNVSVHVAITTGGSQIWTDTKQVGTLDGGATYRKTVRVKLGFMAAAKVQSNGGKITIHTTVASNGGTYSFTQQRDVS